MRHKKFTLIFPIFFLFGCSAQYKYELVKHKNSNISSQQVEAICKPKAELEAMKEKNHSKDKIDSKKYITGYDCSSNFNHGYGSSHGSTNCRAKYNGGWASGYQNAKYVDDAYENTKEHVFASCAAEYGYDTRKICIKNCN